MPKKFPSVKQILLFIPLFAGITFGYAQPKQAAKSKQSSTKATLAADMDCSVKINGAAKLLMVKAYTPLATTIKVGDNYIEALASDKKSKYSTTITGRAGETTIIEISFFDDRKFLDYIKQGNVSMVETAIKKDPGLANNEHKSLTTYPLVIAIQNSQVDIVKLLIANGADFSPATNIYPAHKAALYASSAPKGKDKLSPDKELVDLFLSKGSKITDKDEGGNTLLHCATRGAKLDLVKFFIEKGADVNAKNDFGDTPLKIAEEKGFVSIIDLLKSKGAKEDKPKEPATESKETAESKESAEPQKEATDNK